MHGQVRITLFKNDFNKITELLNMEAIKEDDSKKGYKKFFDKIMTYSFVKEDRVVINLYPSEARLLINIMNKNLNPVVVTNDWMSELISKKEQYKKEKESDGNA